MPDSLPPNIISADQRLPVAVTVPPVPAGLFAGDCWRKILTGLDVEQPGGRAVLGTFVQAGDQIAVADGALLVRVDRARIGTASTYTSNETYIQRDATVIVYLITREGLTELWSRHYATANSAFAAATRNKLATLLTAHPVPADAHEVTVVEEMRRPNREATACRWCNQNVAAQAGHLAGHGEQIQVEHWRTCPPPMNRRPEPGSACVLCGAAVSDTNAILGFVREGRGVWVSQHRPELRCQSNPQKTWEQEQADRAERRAADAQARAKAEKAAARKVARAAERRAAAEDAHRAEQERVAGLTTVSRSSNVLYDKRIGPTLRMQLVEHCDGLEDGTTTTRWTVQSYTPTGNRTNVVETGENIDRASEPFTRLDSARAEYQRWSYDPDRFTTSPELASAALARAGETRRPPRHRSAAFVAGLLGAVQPDTGGRCHYCGVPLTAAGTCADCG